MNRIQVKTAGYRRIRVKTVLTALSAFALILILGASMLAPWLAPCDPNASDLTQALSPPSPAHWLGTDNIGRDLLSRLLYGGRQSIVLALLATVMAMLVGFMMGLLSGYFGGAVDVVITAVSNVFQGLPGLALMIAVAGLMGPGVFSMLTAIVINSWVGFSRIIRGEVMKLRQAPYIDGLRAIDAGNMRTLFLHILPGLLGTICVVFATRVAGVVISVGALSYLGLGLQPPTPDWGVMISDARQFFRRNPLLVIAPGSCILLLSFSINVLADSLRDHFDIREDSFKSL